MQNIIQNKNSTIQTATCFFEKNFNNPSGDLPLSEVRESKNLHDADHGVDDEILHQILGETFVFGLV